MPIREYTCTQGHTFERVERMDEKEEVRRCERCGRPAFRYMDAAGELRDEYDRRKASGEAPRGGWRDAVRYLEEISGSVTDADV